MATADSRHSILVIAFASGSGLMLGWLALGSFASARLRWRSRPAPEPLRAILARVADREGNMPTLLVGSGVAQPVVLGVIRPAIVLPERFAEDEPLVELALAHEWAHVENGDLRFLALSRLLLPLLFAHPFFAWLRSRVRADQEALADLAASRREGRIAYAEALLNWARSGGSRGRGCGSHALGLWGHPSALRRRIALLLDGDSRIEAACSRRWRLSVGTLMVASLIGLGSVAMGGWPLEPFGESMTSGSRHVHQHPAAWSSLEILEDGRNKDVYCCPAELPRCR